MKRALRFLLLAGLIALSAPGLLATAVYLRANGVTFAGLALASAMTLWLSLVAGLLVLRVRKVALVLAALSTALGSSFVIARLARTGPPSRVELCFDDHCGASAWWARIPPEREAARAGLYLSGLRGSMRGAELATFDRLLDVEYAKLGGVCWVNQPNALLLRSTPKGVWYHRSIPHGGGKRPVLVFLHGFGGQLTPYLRMLVESELGREFIVIAPTLDNLGAWWSPNGAAVVERVLQYLPPEADPSRVYLVGLSNGGVGATRLATLPRLRSRIHGAVLVSGVGDAAATPDGTRFLILSGVKDPRFHWAWVQQLAGQLRSGGADVTLEGYEADHFLFLTHPLWTQRARKWLDEN